MANEELKIKNLERTLSETYKLFLDMGIDRVTKVMIAKKSGLSVKSIDRYFPSKTDCVIRVAVWVMDNIRKTTDMQLSDNIFADGNYTGIQLFEKYLYSVKDLFFKEPRIFIVYTEFKLFFYRHFQEGKIEYTVWINKKGNHNLRQRIYNLGKEDGSLSKNIDFAAEEEYICESLFGFLSNLAISIQIYSREEIEKQIDSRIKNTIALYAAGGISKI
jgi:AcrR family transcriptional regulator